MVSSWKLDVKLGLFTKPLSLSEAADIEDIEDGDAGTRRNAQRGRRRRCGLHQRQVVSTRGELSVRIKPVSTRMEFGTAGRGIESLAVGRNLLERDISTVSEYKAKDC